MTLQQQQLLLRVLGEQQLRGCQQWQQRAWQQQQQLSLLGSSRVMCHHDGKVDGQLLSYHN
jgi:hypothetical protein